MTVECQECGKEFEVPKWRRDEAKFCSRECYYESQKIKKRKKEVLCMW